MRTRFLMVLWLVVTLGACSFGFSIKIQNEWLKAPLQRQGNTLVLSGPNLLETALSGNLYTYNGQGEWVPLPWAGYSNGQNTWAIPFELMNRPGWQLNLSRSVDFYGNPFVWWFYGAYPGTSASP